MPPDDDPRIELPGRVKETELWEFGQVDDHNFQASLGRLALLHGGLPLELSEECSRLIDWAVEAAEPLFSVDDAVRTIREWAESNGVAFEDAFGLLEVAHLVGGKSDGDVVLAQEAVKDFHRCHAMALQASRLRRDFMFGLGELIRLRVSPAAGYLRLQAETVALFSLFAEQVDIANDWWDAIGDESGAFWRLYKGRMLDRVGALDLKEDYNRGSWTAQHSRPAGVTLGALLGHQSVGDRSPGAVRLVYQELSNDRPEDLIDHLVVYLGTHEKVVVGLLDLAEQYRGVKLDRSRLDEFSSRLFQLRNILASSNR